MRIKRTPPFLILFCTVVLISFHSFAVPSSLTFQAKIFKPSGAALETAAVSFRFTTLDPTATCILYVEDFSGIDMQDSVGLAVFSLGAGTKIFPATAFSYPSLFNNLQPSFNCQGGGTYSPAAASTDTRKIVLQFNDGSGTGWQTLPAVEITSVPYANFSGNAEKLAGFLASDFLRTSTLPTCGSGTALTFNGITISCVAGGGGGSGTVTSVSSANTDIGVSMASPTPVLTLNSGIGNNQIVKLNGTAQLPAVDGSLLTGFTSAQIPVLDSTKITTGVFSIIRGGTNNEALPVTSGGVIYTDGAKLMNVGAGTLGQVLSSNAAGAPTWINASTGTVTNITAGAGLTGGTITTSGTIGLGTELTGFNGLSTLGFVKRTAAGAYSTPAISLTTDVSGTLPVANGGTGSATVANNLVFAGPATGGPLAPSFRALASSDFPSLSATYLPLAGGTMTGALVNNTSSASTALAITQAGAGYAATLMGGNVGIGTTAPNYLLTVKHPSTHTEMVLDTVTTSTVTNIRIHNNGVQKWAFSNRGDLVTPSDPLYIYNSATPVVTFQQSGNVGVGTTTPAYKVDVAGDVNVTGNFRVNGTIFGGGAGSVTSVQVALPAELTVSGGPITNSGTITGAWASQTANKVFASPDSATGTPSFRIMTANDIPVLDSAKIATGVFPIARGGTNNGTLPVSAGGVIYTDGTKLMNVGAGTLGQVLSSNAAGAPTWINASTGTVTSITAGAGLTGGTITTSGTIGLGTELTGLNSLSTLGFIKRAAAGTYSTPAISLTADVSGTLPIVNGGIGVSTVANNLIFAGPTSGGPLPPSFRALASSDIPSLSSIYLPLTGGTITGTLGIQSTNTATSGTTTATKITATYNQAASTAANTDLLINRTQTLVGTGQQNLIDAQVGGVSKFHVDNTGKIFGDGSGLTGITATPAQPTVAFLTSGTSWTTPAGITASSTFKITVIGAGGGGGGAKYGSSWTTSAGGGAGGVTIWWISGLSPSTAYTYAIGAAGSAGTTTPTNGGNGGNTSITINGITAIGGGGAGGAGNSSGSASAAGGAGGAATGGTIQMVGQAGKSCYNTVGNGGSGQYGMGAPAPASGLGLNAPGNSATGFGGGGSGAIAGTSGSVYAGGTGSPGAILIEWQQ